MNAQIIIVSAEVLTKNDLLTNRGKYMLFRNKEQERILEFITLEEQCDAIPQQRPPQQAQEEVCTDRERLIDHLILHTLPLMRAEISELTRKVDVAHQRIDKLMLKFVNEE